MTEQTIREQAFSIVFKNGRKMVMTLDCVFGEDDDSTEECLNELKQAFAEGASFEIMDAELAFHNFSKPMLSDCFVVLGENE